MKILLSCVSSVSGGAVSYLRNLSSLLSSGFEASQGKHELIFLAHESQRELLTGVPDEHCYWIDGARPTGWRRVLWERHNLNRIANESGAEVVFTPYQIAATVRGVKQVIMLRNMEPFLFGRYGYSWKTALRNRLLARGSRQSLRRADRIIAVSGFARDHLVDKLGIAPERIRTVYHGRTKALAACGDAERDRLLLAELGVEGRFVLTCGSLLPYRRCEDIVRAFDKIAPSLPNGMQLIIAGAGTDRRYGELVRETIVNATAHSSIRLAGHVAWDKMKALYRQCDVCVIATEIEACPNIAIEAMTAGCAIIANDKPPLPEIFDNAYQRYRARDISHLAEVMEQVVSDEGLRGTLKIRSLKRAGQFSWDKCADETYAALTDWS